MVFCLVAEKEDLYTVQRQQADTDTQRLLGRQLQYGDDCQRQSFVQDVRRHSQHTEVCQPGQGNQDFSQY